jgi:hypothetical protein
MQMLGLDVTVGKKQELGGLAVFPLFAGSEPGPGYLSGPDGLETGLAEVLELDPPSVPSLQVVNHGGMPVLFIEGECLLGGDQNRTLNVSVLCGAGQTTVVPVSCVEAGRWGMSRSMSRSQHNLPGSLRSAKTRSIVSDADMDADGAETVSRRSDQGLVWQEVARQTERFAASSPTQALSDVQEEVTPRIENMVAALTVEPGQTGAAYGVGGRVVGLDLFDRPKTLERYLPGLVAGYALDALDLEPGTTPSEAVEAFLAELAGADLTELAGVGLGTELRFTARDLAGIGLAVDGHLVHLAAFAGAADSGAW